MLLNSGDVFAGFTVERLLGEGGMGAVYLARHPRLGKQTALKLLKPELFADAAIRTRFEREADLAAQLDHPGIVTVYDRGVEGEHLWMCMQYIDGADAGTVNPLTLPPDKAVQIIDGVADALDYAHGMGVLHRDVKPSNILLARANTGQGERVFLTDFGLARLRAETVRLTQTGMFTATLAFASPEQMTGGEMDGRSDQYSLACALYWLLTGMAPFDSPNPADIIHGNLQLAPPPLAVKRRGLPPGLDAVLAKAMAKHPGHRYRTCVEFATAAKHALTAPAGTQTYSPGTELSGPGGVYPGAATGFPAAPPAGYPGTENRYPAGAPVPPGAPAPQSAGDRSGYPAPPSVEQTGAATAVPPGAVPPAAVAAPPPAHPVPGAAHPGPGDAERTGAQPVVVAAPPGAGRAPGVEQTGGSAVPPPGQYRGYHPEHSSSRGGNRAALIAVAVLIPLIIVALIVAALLVVVGGDDSDDAAFAPAPSTMEREPTGTSGPGTTDAGRSPGTAPGDRTRRLFPALLPQGSGFEGIGYQDTVCGQYEPGDRIPILEDVAVFREMLESQPWEAVWDCRQPTLSATRLDYTVLTYPDAEAARDVVDSLPPNDSESGDKQGEPYTAHFWDDPADRGRSSTNMVVEFGTGVDSPRGNSLLFVRYWGSAARQDVEQWWSRAPL
ncbi:protein kinase [Nocardia sp. NPDC024068]|uniref:serine/threonine-protein kinase n=1 Tax=Nocardia sp. NPDC024068 TaxID=3157197 RepID=UPI003407CFA4